MAGNKFFYAVSSFAVGLDAIVKWFLIVFGIVQIRFKWHFLLLNDLGVVMKSLAIQWLICHLITWTRIFQLLYFWIQCFFSLLPYPPKSLSVVRCNVVSFTKLLPWKNYSLVKSKHVYAKAGSVPQRTNNLHNSQSSQFWLETILHSCFLSVKKVRGFWDWLSDLVFFPLHSPIFLQFLNSLGFDPGTLLHLLSLVSNWEHWVKAVSSDHSIGWDGASLWPPQLTCPVCVPTQLLSYSQPTTWGDQGKRVGNREKTLLLQKMLFSLSTWLFLCPLHCSETATTVLCYLHGFSHQLKTQNTIQAAVKKVNSVPARSSMDRKLCPS